jgi:branched-chain amino acid transport system substrate-binding protein
VLTRISGIETLDAIVSPTYPREGGVLVRQAAVLGLNVPLFGGDNWGSPEFVTSAGQAANGVFYTAPVEIASPAYAAFAEDFESRYGTQPDVFAAYGYDAAMAVFRAIGLSGTADPEAIRDALHEVSFEGASGHIRFKPNGDVDAQAFARRTIRDGEPRDFVPSND